MRPRFLAGAILKIKNRELFLWDSRCDSLPKFEIIRLIDLEINETTKNTYIQTFNISLNTRTQAHTQTQTL